MGTTITNRVRDLRYANNRMTQQELAEAVGVTRQTIIAIENGKYCPSLEVALKIARTFNTPIDEIFILP